MLTVSRSDICIYIYDSIWDVELPLTQIMDFFLSRFNRRRAPSKDQPHEVAAELSRRVHKMRAQLAILRESIGMQNQSFFDRMHGLLVKEHDRSLENLRRKHGYNIAESNRKYQMELVSLYSLILQDLRGLIDTMTQSFTENKLRSHFGLRKSEMSDGSTCSSSGLSIDDDAPDSILDPISFSIFQDPVVTPEGITYERSILLDYLHKHRNQDPITKRTIAEKDLAPNLAVKAIVTDYLRSKQVMPI